MTSTAGKACAGLDPIHASFVGRRRKRDEVMPEQAESLPWLRSAQLLCREAGMPRALPLASARSLSLARIVTSA